MKQADGARLHLVILWLQSETLFVVIPGPGKLGINFASTLEV